MQIFFVVAFISCCLTENHVNAYIWSRTDLTDGSKNATSILLTNCKEEGECFSASIIVVTATNAVEVNMAIQNISKILQLLAERSFFSNRVAGTTATAGTRITRVEHTTPLTVAVPKVIRKRRVYEEIPLVQNKLSSDQIKELLDDFVLERRPVLPLQGQEASEEPLIYPTKPHDEIQAKSNNLKGLINENIMLRDTVKKLTNNNNYYNMANKDPPMELFRNKGLIQNIPLNNPYIYDSQDKRDDTAFNPPLEDPNLVRPILNVNSGVGETSNKNFNYDNINAKNENYKLFDATNLNNNMVPVANIRPIVDINTSSGKNGKLNMEKEQTKIPTVNNVGSNDKLTAQNFIRPFINIKEGSSIAETIQSNADIDNENKQMTLKPKKIADRNAALIEEVQSLVNAIRPLVGKKGNPEEIDMAQARVDNSDTNTPRFRTTAQAILEKERVDLETIENLKMQAKKMNQLLLNIQKDSLRQKNESATDKLFYDIARKAEEKRIRQEESDRTSTTVSNQLKTVQMTFDETAIKEALRKDPYVQRILKLSNYHRTKYYKHQDKITTTPA